MICLEQSEYFYNKSMNDKTNTLQDVMTGDEFSTLLESKPEYVLKECQVSIIIKL